jgi:predicted small metal-binding protein
MTAIRNFRIFNLFATNRQRDRPRLVALGWRTGEMTMEKEIHCPCGVVIRAESEDALVSEAQRHARAAHDMELSREDALAMARPA